MTAGCQSAFLRRMQTSHPSSPRVIFSSESPRPQSSENTISLGSKKHERSRSIHIAAGEEYTVSPTLTSLRRRRESPTRVSGSLAGIGLLTLSIDLRQGKAEHAGNTGILAAEQLNLHPV